MHFEINPGKSYLMHCLENGALDDIFHDAGMPAQVSEDKSDAPGLDSDDDDEMSKLELERGSTPMFIPPVYPMFIPPVYRLATRPTPEVNVFSITTRTSDLVLDEILRYKLGVPTERSPGPEEGGESKKGKTIE